MSPSSSSDSRPFPESRFVTVDNVRIHCRLWQSQAARAAGKVLLIHGFGGSTYSWRFVGPAMASWGYFTVAVDLPGFGYSDRSSAADLGDLGWSELMWQLIQALEDIGLTEHEELGGGDKWIVAGHSIGGRVAAAMGAQWPQRLQALILVDAALYGPPAAVPLLRFPTVRWLAKKWVQNQLLNERGIERLLTSAYGRTPTPAEVEAYLRPLLQPETVPVILRVGRELPEISGEDLSRIDCPSLVIWGDQDAWIDMKNALRIFNDLANAEIYLVHGAGHIPTETHPEQVIERIRTFLGSE